ncbi:hypothetical protein H4R35_005730 [Dimargaris xerosporica]|nr:hypothetical protein H4R35_005730 [Dimargaris xerosporica]
MKVLLAYAFLQTTIPSYLLAVSATAQRDKASIGTVAPSVTPGAALHRRQTTHGHTSFFYTDGGDRSANEAQTDTDDDDHRHVHNALTRRQFKRRGVHQGERYRPEFFNQHKDFDRDGGYTDDSSGTDLSDVQSSNASTLKRRHLTHRSGGIALASKPTFSNHQGPGLDTDSHTDDNSATDFSDARHGNSRVLKRRYFKRRGVYDAMASKSPVGSSANHDPQSSFNGYTSHSDDNDQGFTTDDFADSA